MKMHFNSAAGEPEREPRNPWNYIGVCGSGSSPFAFKSEAYSARVAKEGPPPPTCTSDWSKVTCKLCLRMKPASP